MKKVMKQSHCVLRKVKSFRYNIFYSKLTTFLFLFVFVFVSVKASDAKSEMKSNNVNSKEVLNKSFQQQKKIITGIIKDQEGYPIIGANVFEINNTTNGTVSDIDGNFTLEVQDNASIRISYIGYFEQIVKTADKTNFNIVLEEDTKTLDEVVVVGYGTQKKANLTGSVSSIDAQSLERRPIISTSASLQGMAPGVTVTTQTGSPGGDGGQISIRGISSFGGSDNSPLILVDGAAITSLDMIDANLIESISVLKDAASASIYGSRAANGVILVTTKRSSKESFSVNYKGYIGKQQEIDIPEVADGEVFMNFFNIANTNDNGYNLYSDEEIAEFREKYKANPSNYDWQSEILSGSGFTHNHFISLMASSPKIRVMPSFSYSSQDGIIKNTGFERHVFRNNMDITPNDKLSIKLDMSFINSDRLQIAKENDVWNYLGRMPTNIPIRHDDLWSEGWVKVNPVGLIEDGGNRKTKSMEFLGNLSVDLKPTDWITLTGIFAPRYRTLNRHTFSKSVMTYNDDGSEAGSAYTYTDLEETAYRYFFGNLQFFATMSKEINNHSLKLMVGTSRETYDRKYLMGYRRNYTYDTYEVLTAGADDETKDNNGTQEQWLLVSGFSRFNYGYKDKYLFEANIRHDGSSRFSKNNRWATFPSFSAAWRISEESFMDNTRGYIDQIKLRGSWGKLGNQNIGSSYYPYVSQLSVGSISMNKEIHQLVTLNDMANAGLKWEETTMTGVGVDLTLFNHFNFTADWYRKNTDGILLKLYTSQLTGLNAPFQNAAKVRNTGWEISANYTNRWNDFKFSAGFNLSDVKNVITDMKGQSSGDLLRQQEGYAINSIYGYIAEGLYQTQEEIDAGPVQIGALSPGDIKYKDIAGDFDENNNPIPDGKITDEDKTIIGSTIPRFNYGMNFDFGWKGLKLSAFFQGVGKVNGYLNSHYVIPGAMSSAIKTWQLDYWTEENRDASFPRPSITSSNNTQNSTYWMKSAAYLRLKNLQLGYELPRKLVKDLKLSNVYLYVNGQNLFTKTNFWKGYDPEINFNAGASDGVSLGGGGFYPQVKVFSLGIDIKF